MPRVSNKIVWKVSFFPNSNSAKDIYLRSKECIISGNGMAVTLDGGVTAFFNDAIYSVVIENSVEAKSVFSALSLSNKKGNAVDMNQAPGNSWCNGSSIDDIKL